jgi:hypothetical protein
MEDKSRGSCKWRKRPAEDGFTQLGPVLYGSGKHTDPLKRRIVK